MNQAPEPSPMAKTFPSSAPPLISVVMPTFNRAATLRRVIDSVLNQKQDKSSFSFEFLVSNNASTDETSQVLSEYGEKITVVYEARAGESYARNAAIKIARGEWLAFFDDDQVADDHWLDDLLHAAQSRGALIVSGSTDLELSLQEQKELGPNCCRFLGKRMHSSTAKLAGRELPAAGNVLVHRSVFERIGIFDEDLTVGADSNFFLRAEEAEFAMWGSERAVIWHQVPEDRLRRAFLLERAQWQGAYFVLLGSRGSTRQALYLALTRLLFAIAVHGPQWAFHLARGQKWWAVGHQIRIWRAWGCLRGALRVCSPKHFSQPQYFKDFADQTRQRNQVGG